MTLLELNDGEKGIIVKVRGRGAFRKRLIEMGFVVGKEIIVIKKAPLQDPIEYYLMNYNISLRRSEANLIEISKDNINIVKKSDNFKQTILEDNSNYKESLKSKIINVALVGNPNSGKTTLYNYASGSKERVGNYSGVTVNLNEATFKLKDYTFNIVDLPGTYSISAYSPEEIYVRNYIFDNIPDIVINVVDASNLERNLYLTTQLIDMDIKVIIALNMFDELASKGIELNHHALGKLLGIPIIPTIASKGTGISDLFERAIAVYEDKDDTLRHVHINYGETIEKSIKNIQKRIKIPENAELTDIVSSRFLSIKLLEKDKDAFKTINEKSINAKEILALSESESNYIEKFYTDNSETIITELKYGFIAGAIKETYVQNNLEKRKTSEIIDTFLTHKLFGFPIFFLFMWLMFAATFTLGSYPMHWIESGVDIFSSYLSRILSEGPLKNLIINGIISGVGGVIIYFPNILILFLFISFMEDSGYMARTVFIMDKLMHKIGLHGKSFIPLLMGFGCNVPAIMATRTIENRNDRLLTMLINPFMSCSARLPVYVLFISAFFPSNPGTILFVIYLIGISIAVLFALLMKKTLFKASDTPFVMELPPYRIPTLRSTTIHMWNKGSQYLRKIGGIILLASIVIWALSYYPSTSKYTEELKQNQSIIKTKYNNELSFIMLSDTIALMNINKQKNAELSSISLITQSKIQENSYIGWMGKFIEPAIQPLGFDWKMGISIISGIAAKEIVVSTMGVLYQVNNDESTDKDVSLINKLQTQKYQSGANVGKNIFNPLVAFAFMIFILLYFPCLGTITAITKESGSWKWGVFVIIYTTTIAWVASFLVFQIGSLFLHY